jgi:hypothetical protein
MRFDRFLYVSIAPLAAALATGCGDPVPPTPQGAWTASFGPAIDAAADCTIAQHTASIGAVSASTKDKVLADATDGAEIRCSVIGDKTFNVSGHAERKGIGIDINVKNLTPSATDQAPVAGSVTFVSDKTVVPFASANPDKPCQFYFADPKEGVSGGQVWLAFRCPDLSVSSPQSVCQISQGYAIFENCTKE